MPIHDWTRVEAGVFHDFHTTWIPDIKRTLINGLLPPSYYAMVEQVASGPIPDVLTLQRDVGSNRNGRGMHLSSSPSGSMVALAEAPPRSQFRSTTQRDPYAARARSIVVRHSEGDRVVAVIEIVSPGNKNRRDALRAFVEKAADWLRSGVHLLIIDLFPPGPFDPQGIHPAIWSQFDEDEFELSIKQPLTLASYIGGTIKEAFIQPVSVGELLPERPLFLERDGYINLPLEESYMSAFVTVPPHWRELLESPR